MRLLSPKQLCIGSVALIAACILAVGGASVVVQRDTGNTFEQEGYILTVTDEDGAVVVSNQNRFSEGTKWTSGNYGTVSFLDEGGNEVICDTGSFIHYGSNALSATTSGTLIDLDSYLDGKLVSYYLPVGTTLSYDGSSYVSTTLASNDALSFDNFVWKDTDDRFLIVSPRLQVVLASGDTMATSEGYLELTYVDDNNDVIQITDGDQAWQVMAEGCRITLQDGIVIDAKTGEITDGSRLDEETDGEGELQTISLGTISLSPSDSIVIDNTNTSEAPVFYITTIDGEDGLAGENGVTGEKGEAGETGETGESGTDGDAGEDGAEGETGEVGIGGGSGTAGIKGDFAVNANIQTGKPTVWVRDNTWVKDGVDLSFALFYNIPDNITNLETSTDAGGNPVSPYFYIYDMETGERADIEVSASGTLIGNGSVVNGFYSIKEPDSIGTLSDSAYTTYQITKGLEYDKTYCLTVVDTYVLAGTEYTTKVMERIFTTGSSEIDVAMTNRTESSLSMSVTPSSKVESSAKISSVSVEYTYPGGTPQTVPVNGNQASEITLSDLQSDTKYTVTTTVKYTVNQTTSEGSVEVVEKTYTSVQEWTTLKATPSLGGIRLTAEEGYLLAEALGQYDTGTKTYKSPTDPNSALQSIVFSLYTLNANTNTLELVDTQTVTSGYNAYFNVDGATIRNNYTYYVMAEYAYDNGALTVQIPIMESDSSKVTEGSIGVKDSPVNGRAISSAKAIRSNGVSISFSGKSSGLYNVSIDEDSSEGISYNAIRGSLLVNLNGTVIRVDKNHKLTVTVTDYLTYDNSQTPITLDNCGGKRGNIQGTFAIPLNLDGLLANNTYAVSLKAQVYDSNLDVYQEESVIGTIILRTAEATDVVIGMEDARDREGADKTGVGVYFWLGYGNSTSLDSSNKLSAKEKQNLFGTGDYLTKTDAVYRNLSGIVFRLYRASDTSFTNPIGECVVEVKKSQGDDTVKETFDPEYSPIYREYYGAAAFKEGTTASVGVGQSYDYRFIDPNTGYEVQESTLSGGSATYVICAEEVYDYTYDRTYDTSGIYTYLIGDIEESVNRFAPVSEPITVVYAEHPGVEPDTIVDANKFAIGLTKITNTEAGIYNVTHSSADADYDDALQKDTIVGLTLSTKDASGNFDDAKYVTYYGMTGTTYSNWKAASSFDTLKTAENATELLPFQFTVTNVTQNDLLPKLTLLMYDGTDPAWTEYFEDEANGYSPTQTFIELDNGENVASTIYECNDRGYKYYRYDASNNTYIIYIDTHIPEGTDDDDVFFARGNSYAFVYDAVLDFAGQDFNYPAEYYSRGWMSGQSYKKTQALRSQVEEIAKQMPIFYQELTNSREYEMTDEQHTLAGQDTFSIYLDDPDDAVLPESLYGYFLYDGIPKTDKSGMFDGDGNDVSYLTNQDNTYQVLIQFQLNGEDYSLVYYLDGDQLKSKLYRGTSIDDTKLVSDTTNEETGEESEKLRIFTELLESMRAQAGNTVTFSQLNASGVCYQWRAAVDIYADNMPVSTVIAYHRYTGKCEITIDQDNHTLKGSTSDTVYDIESEADDESHRVMTVKFVPQTDSSSENPTPLKKADMIGVLGRLGMVKIEASYQDADNKTVYVTDAASTDEDTPERETVWAGVSYYDADGYYEFRFNITDFDTSQYSGQKTLTFHYTFYYDDGSIVPMNVAVDADGQATITLDENTYYALRSMTRSSTGTAIGYYYQANNTTSKVKVTTEDFALGTKNAGMLSSIFKMSSVTIDRSEIPTTYTYEIESTPVTEKFAASSITSYLTFRDTRLDESTGKYVSIKSYANDEVYEIAPLAMKTYDYNYEIKTVAPSINTISFGSGLGEAQVNLSLKDYGLITYYRGTENETTQTKFRFTVYKDFDTDDEDGKVVLDNAETVGESIVMDPYEELVHSNGYTKFSQKLTGLEKDTKYYLKIEYNDENSTKDKDEWQTLTGAKDESLIFTTLEGVKIDTVGLSLGAFGDYVNSNDKDNYSSGKTMTLSMTAEYGSDDIEGFYVVERRPIGSTSDSAWKVVMADEDLYNLYRIKTANANATTSFELALYSQLWQGSNGSDPVFCEVDTGVFQTFQAADAKDGTGVHALENVVTGGVTDASHWTVPLSVNYKAGGAIVPGFEYRAKAILVQKTNGNYTKIVSLGTTQRGNSYVGNGLTYGKSSSNSWPKYEYSEADPLVSTTRLAVANTKTGDVENQTLTATIQRNDAYNFGRYNILNNTIYVRLAKKNPTTGAWEIVQDPDCYGEFVNNRKICNYPLQLGYASYSISFQNLDPGSEYRIQYYALTDTDFDGKINIADSSGTPLKGNSENTYDLYTSGGYGSAYLDFLGITSSAEAYKMMTKDGGDLLAKAKYSSQIMICASESITTLQAGQLGTVGDMGNIDHKTDYQMVIEFEHASGLDQVKYYSYTLQFVSSDLSIDRTITEDVYKATGAASIMDNGDTGGSVTLTIKNTDSIMKWSTMGAGNYYFQLYIYYENGQVEQLESRNFTN